MTRLAGVESLAGIVSIAPVPAEARRAGKEATRAGSDRSEEGTPAGPLSAAAVSPPCRLAALSRASAHPSFGAVAFQNGRFARRCLGDDGFARLLAAGVLAFSSARAKCDAARADEAFIDALVDRVRRTRNQSELGVSFY